MHRRERIWKSVENRVRLKMRETTQRGLRVPGSQEYTVEKDLKLTSYLPGHHMRGIHFQQQRGTVVNDVVRERIGLKPFSEYQRIPAAV